MTTGGIEADNMYFIGTGIWGGETMNKDNAFEVFWVCLSYSGSYKNTEL